MLLRWRNGLLLATAFLFLSVAAARVHGADAEERAFSNARAALDDGFHPRAEKAFADFIAKYPASPRVPQAWLHQSEAALQQKKFRPALDLLATNFAGAGGLADQFQLAIADIYFESGQREAAATNYAALVTQYTNSPLRLRAVLGEAQARFALRQWPRVAELLQNPAGLFHVAAARTPAADLVVKGQLLLAETLLEQKNFSAAEQAAGSIPEFALSTRTKWERAFLAAKAQLGARQLEAALAATSNLVTIATATGEAPLEAASVAMQGEILEALHRPEEAVAAYARNQRPGVPAERAREALFKTVEMTLAQGQLSNGLARLEEFVKAHPNESSSDIALLTLAELRLKQHQLALLATNSVVTNGVVAGTDLLSEAIEHCDKLVRGFTNSALVGKAQLVRGWALLVQGKTPESLAAFRAAVAALPWSEPQAVARFKTADLEFQSGELTNALGDYRRVLGDYAALPGVQSELAPRARYQMLQASLAARDRAAAEEVLQALLDEYPSNGYAERSLLLYGQAVDEMGDPAAARKVFAKFSARFPGSTLRPEVELAVARSLERERDWPGVIAKYEEWVAAFPTNSQLPDTEYRRARANSQAGLATNAFTLFTNFVARFPTDPLAARAQNRVGDFYFRAGQFDDAVRSYQLVFENTNWPVTVVSYEARLKAGRAALLRPSLGLAALHFTNLINDPSCPTSIVVQAYFGYAETWQKNPSTNVQENFTTARQIYELLLRSAPADPLTNRAHGEAANCYFQLGRADPANYAKAVEHYAVITNSPTADPATRQQALVGLGHVLRRQSDLARKDGRSAEADALLEAALVNYLNVVYADREGEAPDQLWVKEAMLNAAEVSESRGQWESALKLYQRLGEKIPILAPGLKPKIDAAGKQMELRKQ